MTWYNGEVGFRLCGLLGVGDIRSQLSKHQSPGPDNHERIWRVDADGGRWVDSGQQVRPTEKLYV